MKYFEGTENEEIARILGDKGTLGKYLGLRKGFGKQILSQVGNYEEVYNHTMKKVGVSRGLNKIWTKGGLLYTPPMR